MTCGYAEAEQVQAESRYALRKEVTPCKNRATTRTSIGALAFDELRIIGVEFNVRHQGGRTIELAMFVPNGNGLVIPRERSLHGRQNEYQPTITFHSTIGDYTIGNNDYQCPW